MNLRKTNLNLLTFCLLFFLFLSPAQAVASSGDEPAAFSRGSELRIGYGNFPALIYNGLFSSPPEGEWWHFFDVPEMLPPMGDATQMTFYSGRLVAAGTFALNYTYRVNRWFEFNVTASCAPAFGRMYDWQTRESVGNYSVSYFSLLPSARFVWLNRPLVRLYSGISLGAAFREDRWSAGSDRGVSREFVPGISVTWFGLTVGKRVYGFAELNSGVTGFCQAGIGYSF